MNVRTAVLSVVLWSSLAACGTSKATAKASLEEDGYSNVVIGAETAGAYSFTADDKDGMHCTGTITIKGGMGSTTKQTQRVCTGP